MRKSMVGSGWVVLTGRQEAVFLTISIKKVLKKKIIAENTTE